MPAATAKGEVDGTDSRESVEACHPPLLSAAPGRSARGLMHTPTCRSNSWRPRAGWPGLSLRSTSGEDLLDGLAQVLRHLANGAIHCAAGENSADQTVGTHRSGTNSMRSPAPPRATDTRRQPHRRQPRTARDLGTGPWGVVQPWVIVAQWGICLTALNAPIAGITFFRRKHRRHGDIRIFEKSSRATVDQPS